MAIKTSELEEITEEELKAADELEKIIDSVLNHDRSNAREQRKISFTVNNNPNAPSKATREEVEKRYKAVGWESVKFKHSYVKGYDDYWCLSVTLTKK